MNAKMLSEKVTRIRCDVELVALALSAANKDRLENAGLVGTFESHAEKLLSIGKELYQTEYMLKEASK